MLRFSNEEHEFLRSAAFQSRLPVATFAKELVLGKVPKVAPPKISDLSDEAQILLNELQHVCSNLTQIERYAAAAGQPLEKLAGEGGILRALNERAREIGMRIKTGSVCEDQQIGALLTAISNPAKALNFEISRPLNLSQVVPLETWKTILQQLQSVFLNSKGE